MKGGREGKKKGRYGQSEGGECNRKLLSELPMASSQSVQTLRNSRQRAGREGRCQEGEREAGKNEEGGSHLWFVVKGYCYMRKEEHTLKAISLCGRTLTFLLGCNFGMNTLNCLTCQATAVFI